ncbi:hypothetical protein CC2G_010662 [Coprinopsis cinerea AmutBmut pab1-1]|nr:hypothetical protein CC2G_010662 [Coprinopsis cinerea AmutBmut pab1-1]
MPGDLADIFTGLGTDSKTEDVSGAHAFSGYVTPLKSGAPVKPYDLTHEARTGSKGPRRRPLLVAPTSREARKRDIFAQLDIDPLSLATSPAILSHFVTNMGQIKPRTQTGLTVKSQRKLGKAIRRARMMGVIPILSRLPETRWR